MRNSRHRRGVRHRSNAPENRRLSDKGLSDGLNGRAASDRYKGANDYVVAYLSGVSIRKRLGLADLQQKRRGVQ